MRPQIVGEGQMAESGQAKHVGAVNDVRSSRSTSIAIVRLGLLLNWSAGDGFVTDLRGPWWRPLPNIRRTIPRIGEPNALQNEFAFVERDHAFAVFIRGFEERTIDRLRTA